MAELRFVLAPWDMEMIADLLVSGKVKARLVDDEGKPMTADTTLTSTPASEQ